MSSSKRLLNALTAEFGRERAFLDALPQPSRAGHGSPNSWSAKDLQIHITAWKHQTVLRLAGDSSAVIEESDDDTDHANAEFFEAGARQTWETALEAAHATHRELKLALPKLSEAELADTERFPWQDGLPLWRRLAGTLLLHPWMHMAEHALAKGDTQAAVDQASTMLHALMGVSEAPLWIGVLYYNAACIAARAGQPAQAFAWLRPGLEIRPELIEWSKQDTDLASLRSDDRLAALYTQLEP
jgi:hypothetical protein